MSNKGNKKTKTDFRCLRSDTSKLVYSPFLDRKYKSIVRGTNTQPIIKKERKDAVSIFSFENITMATNNGRVNKGCPNMDINVAIFVFKFIFKCAIFNRFYASFSVNHKVKPV